MKSLGYGFFDYKYNIQGFSSDLFSIAHIIYIILGIAAVVLACIFLRKISHRKITIFLRVLGIVLVLLEIAKITFESYYDITTGRGFNAMGILPLYTCSLFEYTVLIAGFSKGRAKDYSLAFIGTIGLVSGLIGMIQCNGLNWYPFWTFGAFHSLFFHFAMFATGVFVLATGYKRLNWIDIYKGWVPMLIFSIIVTPVNYAYGGDYMQTYEGGGVPLFNKLAEVLVAHNLRPIFTIIMLIAYLLLTVVPVCLYKLIEYLIMRKSKDKPDPAPIESKQKSQQKV